MTVKILKVIEPMGENVHYCVWKDLDKYHGLKTPIEIKIPDRFLPSDDLEGNVYLKLNGQKGKYFLLENVLVTDRYQNPALKWFDETYKFWRTVSLEWNWVSGSMESNY